MGIEIKNEIVKISQEILDRTISFRESHPGFTLSLRGRDSAQSDEKRLETGQWFQGSDYIYVPLFKRGDSARKIKTLGFALTFEDDGSIEDNYLEISFKEGIDKENEIEFHKELARELNITLNKYNHGSWSYNDCEAYLSNLDDYFTRVYPLALGLLEKYNLTTSYVVEDDTFLKRLAKIKKIKENILEQNNALINTTSLIGYQPLNQILFGPPGTGKTYNSINRALEILGDSLSGKSREDVRRLFNKRFNEGRIQFSTFHQSMSYEDFIEGIKPKTLNNQVVYEVEDGIFKKICDAARIVSGNFEQVLEQFKKDISELDGKPPLTIAASATSFDIIFRGTNVFYVQPHNTIKENPWYPVNIQNIRKALETDSYNGIYNPTYVREVINYLKKNYALKKGPEQHTKEIKPYILIIDEINRGNVSQIFGELITLIEEDKREGRKEELSVILPYSKELFSVPSNLHIIGTLNTADRSVEALDTALRRRFVFEEMTPEPELLTPARMVWRLWWDYENVDWKGNDEYEEKEKMLYELLGFPDHIRNDDDEKSKFWDPMQDEGMNEKQIESLAGLSFTGINLCKMLTHINRRIEKLLGKDYTIGHAYMINVGSLNDLRTAFHNKLLPLLQEYFYGDFGRIGLVIGEVFLGTVSEQKEVEFMSVGGYETGDLNEAKIYKIQNVFTWDDQTFIKNIKAIYGDDQ